ncbi:hypothetical protein DAI22_08g168350 [Oryza sativa Japonica Group]|nr:hypothetical protein DAI22_08g168350 [Oryza sativa Japonica Group]
MLRGRMCPCRLQQLQGKKKICSYCTVAILY